MTNIQRYHTQDLGTLVDKIMKNSVGMDDYFNQFFNFDSTTNYPPYNLVQINNVDSRLEIALAGFSKEEVKVYTEYGRIVVEGKKEKTEEESEYLHRGLAQRSFQRAWALSEDITVKDVNFADGLLTIKLGKVIPEHHARKDYL
ncbi:small heat shock protein IbpA [Cyanophage S-SSM6a]|jgi:HSP20 family molecular chaperone IbpA|uniref:Heat shock protein n=1 Tax=Synechococcus phage S-SSM7 TaxID=445686 RepID=E3SL94_9CAUD|nr:Hsp20 heat shock protein [Synechococcus phage S-SSM7]ADO98242.1 heat shock protein [Synechococcus phage S-SSM7]AGH07491.1 small heat shock protein IbpA [Cyanophage S-SSM6a]|tara:strand:- start:1116 stop:1547 length:432 start_codon:yes stop_codon:yes gene_type:complete